MLGHQRALGQPMTSSVVTAPLFPVLFTLLASLVTQTGWLSSEPAPHRQQLRETEVWT